MAVHGNSDEFAYWRQDGSVTDVGKPAQTGVRAPHNRWRWYLGAGIGLLYLIYPAFQLVADDRHALGWRIAGLCGLVVFAVIYVAVVPRLFSDTGPARWLVPVALFAISLLWLPTIGPDLASTWTFVGVAAAISLSMGRAALVGGLLGLAMIGLDYAYGVEPEWWLALTVVAVSVWMAAFMSNVRSSRELRAARGELARLAVAEERQRISRDLHDILGHSLTAITLKAALARRLVDRDPAAAVEEIAEVERMSRDALADIRATASGLRDVSLAGELVIAGSVLRSAGITPSLPTAVDEVAPEGREVFGFVVREAVTNVVRHAHATRCAVTVTPRSVEIVDDGLGTLGRGGTGLTGLAERVEAVGGRLVAGPAPSGGFRVRAELDR